MKQIWKWPIEVLDEQVIEVPASTKFLTAQVQDESICVWGEVSIGHPTFAVKRRIRIIGTGNPMPSVDMLRFGYLATVQDVPFPGLVWHIYVEAEQR